MLYNNGQPLHTLDDAPQHQQKQSSAGEHKGETVNDILFSSWQVGAGDPPITPVVE